MLVVLKRTISINLKPNPKNMLQPMGKKMFSLTLLNIVYLNL